MNEENRYAMPNEERNYAIWSPKNSCFISLNDQSEFIGQDYPEFMDKDTAEELTENCLFGNKDTCFNDSIVVQPTITLNPIK